MEKQRLILTCRAMAQAAREAHKMAFGLQLFTENLVNFLNDLEEYLIEGEDNGDS